MPKLIKSILIIFMFFSMLMLTGCEIGINYENTDNNKERNDLPGGYSEERILSETDLVIFNEAVTDLVGVNYEPISVATQVVNGINYRFYTTATVIYPNSEPYHAYVYIFDSLDPEKSPVITNIVKIDE